MSAEKGESVKEFENECEEILHLVVIDQAFLKNNKRIIAFIEQNTSSCTEFINNQQFKSCLFILTKLHNVCVEILRGIPKDIDSQGKLRHIFTQLRLKEKKTNTQQIDFPAFIFLLQSFGSLPDITQLRTPDSFHYSLVLEQFLLIANNLAYINLKRNKFDATITHLLTSIECFTYMQSSSYYIKYHITTIIINLVYLLEDNHREEISQLLCNVALYLEKLEKELDGHPESKNIYDYLNDKAWDFVLFTEMKDQIFGKKSYKNKKSFFLARMCVTMAYYGDLLGELGKKHESEIARQHTKALEQQLIRVEQPRHKGNEESKLTQENVDKKFQNRGSQRKVSSDDDNYSSASFKSANTGFTGGTAMENQAKISKEDIIYQKYVEVNSVKFKILMIHMKELQAVQVMVYSKPRNMLKKVYLHFQEILDYAKEHGINVAGDQDANKILTKIAKLLYFKDNELLMKEIQFFRSIDALKTHAFQASQ